MSRNMPKISTLLNYFLFWGCMIAFTGAVISSHDLHTSRHKRSTQSETSRLQNLSPSDRPSCKPDAQKPNTQVDTSQRLANLRNLFDGEGINAYLIPSEDAHQSEYPSDHDLRRGFISGMSGSAGIAVVVMNKAALWTDGRYFLEAESQLDCNWILMKQGETGVPSITEWLVALLSATNGTVGASPYLVSSSSWTSMEKNLAKHGITMKQIGNDLVDRIWTTDRPAQPNSAINALPMNFAGKTWQDKMIDVHNAMADKDADILIITGLDETAWMFNLRASDISYNPFFLSYAIIDRPNNKTTLYIKDHTQKLAQNQTDTETSQKLYEHLNTNMNGVCSGTGLCVDVVEYDNSNLLTKVDQVVAGTSNMVWVAFSCNYAIYSKISEGKLLQENTPISLQKAQKNAVERDGMKNSHVRDGLALISFLAKLEKEVKAGTRWTEVSAAQDLKKYREQQLYNRGLSFGSISGFGPNGAIIHYTATALTDAVINTSNMYLLDSGGQYLDGTTDVTRTFHFGTPTAYQKECYTRVLMGQVDLADFKFVTGNLGREIDAIARRPLWDVGLQYRHGTGHGIGMYLSVHEGPGRISLSHSSFVSDEPLNEWQFFSDEPGYYEDGQFGIRLENIVMIKKVDTKYKFPGTTFLGFETVTMVPYEPNLIDYDLLSQRQIDWINSYHKQVQDTIGPLLRSNTEAATWLETRTRPYTRGPVAGAQSLSYSYIVVSLLTIICLLFNF